MHGCETDSESDEKSPEINSPRSPTGASVFASPPDFAGQYLPNRQVVFSRYRDNYLATGRILGEIGVLPPPDSNPRKNIDRHQYHRTDQVFQIRLHQRQHNVMWIIIISGTAILRSQTTNSKITVVSVFSDLMVKSSRYAYMRRNRSRDTESKPEPFKTTNSRVNISFLS